MGCYVETSIGGGAPEVFAICVAKRHAEKFTKCGARAVLRSTEKKIGPFSSRICEAQGGVEVDALCFAVLRRKLARFLLESAKLREGWKWTRCASQY
jgi:hypothetical protein